MMIKLCCHLCLDFPAVAGGEETEEAKAASELWTTVSQHTGRYMCFSSSYLFIQQQALKAKTSMAGSSSFLAL